MPTNTQEDAQGTEVNASPISSKINNSNKKRRKKRESAASTSEVTSTATESVLTETAPVTEEVPATSEEVTSSTVTEEPIVVTEPVTETAPVAAEETTSNPNADNAGSAPTEEVTTTSEEVTSTVTEEPIVTEPPVITATVLVAAEDTTSNDNTVSTLEENSDVAPDHNAIMDPINEDELKNSLATITDFSTKANVLFGYNSRVGLGTLLPNTQINLAEVIATIGNPKLTGSLSDPVAISIAGKLTAKLSNL